LVTRLLGSHLLACSLSCHQSYPSILCSNWWGRTVRPLRWGAVPDWKSRALA